VDGEPVIAGKLRRRLGRLHAGGDAGVTLIEAMVTMMIMSIMMAIFTTGILQVYRATNATESLSTAQSQLHIVFQRLDTEIRYASWIAEPGEVGGRWYVEFAAVDRVTRQPRCAQLRLEPATGVLRQLSWTPGSPPLVGDPGMTLASQVVTDSAVLAAEPVFTREAAGSYPYAGAGVAGASFSPDFHRLRLRLTIQVGAADQGGTARSDVTFTALNTSRDTPVANTCAEGRPTT
jgi:prepilin-type N-terminal cleavage/methylation domain-containing protein